MSVKVIFKKIVSHVIFTAVAMMLTATVISAATVTVDEAGLDAIFSQGVFGATPIDVRISSTETLIAPQLLKVTTERETNKLLFGMASRTSDIKIFFVDELDYCGGFNIRIVGCGAIGSPGVIVESEFAAGIYGAETLAHELAHNLGVIEHESGLLSASLDGNLTVNEAQAAKILISTLVQEDALGFFLQINPVLVTGAGPSSTGTSLSAVPLPAGGIFLLSGLGLLVGVRRARAAALLG